MFEDMMGNLEKQQAEMQNKLIGLVVEIEQDGVTIAGNAAKRVTNINISQELLSGGDSEMLEDLLIAVFNRFIEEATKVEASEAENIMKDMLPPDFSNMFK